METMKLIKISNIGNTCYFNSVIQIFLNMTNLNNYLKNSENKITSNVFTKEYLKFIKTNESKYLYNIFTLLKCKNEQMDANSLLLKILEYFEESPLNKFLYLKYNSKSPDKGSTLSEECSLSNWINYEFLITELKNKNITNFPDYLIINNWNNNQINYKLKFNSCSYKIKILLCFIGADNSGHYFVVINKKNKWIQIDDDCISEISDINTFLNYVNVITIIYKK